MTIADATPDQLRKLGAILRTAMERSGCVVCGGERIPGYPRCVTHAPERHYEFRGLCLCRDCVEKFQSEQSSPEIVGIAACR